MKLERHNSKLAHQKEQLNHQVIELEKLTQQRRSEFSKEDIDYQEQLANLNKH